MSMDLYRQIAAAFSRDAIDAALRRYADSPELVTVSNVRATFRDLGRENVPTFLSELDTSAGLAPDVLRPLVGAAWKLATVPELLLESARWVMLFLKAGYSVDGVSAPVPAGPLRLWRGALPDYRWGMSWSDDLSVAERFATRVAPMYSPGELGRVWTAVARPSQLLAFTSTFDPFGAQQLEREYVVDTAALVVTEWGA